MCCVALQRLQVQVATRVRNAVGWAPNVRQNNFELNVYVGSDYFAVGIPLTKYAQSCTVQQTSSHFSPVYCRRPFSDHAYVKHLSLRTTTCDALIALLRVEADSTLLDPMCGAGTILIELVRRTPKVLLNSTSRVYNWAQC